MVWGHAIGIYLLAGVVLNGLGHLVRARWIASRKMEPLKFRKGQEWFFWVGILAGVLLWPVFLVTISIGWRMKRKTRKLEKFLGYCEHFTPLEPICGPCSRAMDQERELGARVSNYIKGRRPDDKKVQELKAKLAAIAEAQQHLISAGEIQRLPSDPERGAPGSSGVPAYLDPVVKSLYRCSACGLMSEGPAPSANAQGWPLCVKCKIEDLNRIK